MFQKNVYNSTNNRNRTTGGKLFSLLLGTSALALCLNLGDGDGTCVGICGSAATHSGNVLRRTGVEQAKRPALIPTGEGTRFGKLG